MQHVSISCNGWGEHVTPIIQHIKLHLDLLLT